MSLISSMQLLWRRSAEWLAPWSWSF